MRRALAAGNAYCALVFAAGFLLGTLRVLLLEPVVGTGLAILIELPLMLVVAWVACRWALARWQVPPATADRLVMGLGAFALLMAAELATGMVLMGRTAAQQREAMLTPANWPGLAAQLAYAALPLVQRRRSHRR